MTFNLRVFWGGESAPQAYQQYAGLLHSSSASWAEHLSLKGVNIEQLDPVGSFLPDDEAVFWVSIGHYEGVAVGN